MNATVDLKFKAEDVRALLPRQPTDIHIPDEWQGTALDILRDVQGMPADRLWLALQMLPDRIGRMFACRCARLALELEGVQPDPRSLAAVEVAERYAGGAATVAELDAANDAADDAVWASKTPSWWAAKAAWWATCRPTVREAFWESAFILIQLVQSQEWTDQPEVDDWPDLVQVLIQLLEEVEG